MGCVCELVPWGQAEGVGILVPWDVMCPPGGCWLGTHLQHVQQTWNVVSDYTWQTTNSNPGLSQRVFPLYHPRDGTKWH